MTTPLKINPLFTFSMLAERVLSLNAMDKIIRETGLRVSDDAKEALADILQLRAKELSLSAKRFAEHAGRRTVTAKDIQLAAKDQQ